MIPEMEIDEDGYPTQDSLNLWGSLGRFTINYPEARKVLIEDFLMWCDQIPCSSYRIEDALNKWTKKPLKRIYFSTGGWSGAEDLIEALLNQFWIKHYHTVWKRGGHFEFEVPVEPNEVTAEAKGH